MVFDCTHNCTECCRYCTTQSHTLTGGRQLPSLTQVLDANLNRAVDYVPASTSLCVLCSLTDPFHRALFILLSAIVSARPPSAHHSHNPPCFLFVRSVSNHDIAYTDPKEPPHDCSHLSLLYEAQRVGSNQQRSHHRQKRWPPSVNSIRPRRSKRIP